MTTEIIPDGKDNALWRQAKRRVNFRHHLLTYIAINAFLWAIWFFTAGRYYDGGHMPWPLWASLGWGIGLVMDFINSYVVSSYPEDKNSQIEKEYQKLKKQQENL